MLTAAFPYKRFRMPQQPEEARNFEEIPEFALEDGLARAARELGATTVAVLVVEKTSVEVACGRNASGKVQAGPIDCRIADVRDALINAGGPAVAKSPVARFLAASVAPEANSFLIFPWRSRRRVVVIAFGFAEPQTPHTSVPAHITESLHLTALAAWSLKEVTRLHAELRVANSRFTGRKLVERAKAALQERGMTEQQAYEYLRKMSRQRRITLTRLAEDLLGRGRWP
jgi:ANTAR domain